MNDFPDNVINPFDTATLKGRLRFLMSKHDMRQRHLADLMGVTPTAVTRWIKHDGGMSKRQAERLGDALDVSPDWILYGNNAETERNDILHTKFGALIPLGLHDYRDGQWTLVSEEVVAVPHSFFLRHSAVPKACIRTRVQESLPNSPIQQWDIITLEKSRSPSPSSARIVSGNLHLVEVDHALRCLRVTRTHTHIILEGHDPALTETVDLDEAQSIKILGRILHVERERF